jgi:hypothetical protein
MGIPVLARAPDSCRTSSSTELAWAAAVIAAYIRLAFFDVYRDRAFRSSIPLVVDSQICSGRLR